MDYNQLEDSATTASNYAFTKAYLIVKKQKEIPTTPIYEPRLNAYYI